MKWMTALKWSTPIWIMATGAVGATMYLTDFIAEVGTAEAIKRLALVGICGLPLIAFLVKATSDDVMRFRAAISAEDAEERDS